MSKEMTAVSVKEPLMHISKRDGIEPYKAWLIRLAAVLISLIVCAGVIFALTGLNPIEVYKGVFDGAVGTKRRVWMTIRDTLVLLCIAIGITPAFKMRFWNIGAEGQVLIGGVTSAAMMIYLGNSLPPVLLFPLMLAGSALSAMVWAAIPAFFKAYWNTNETLFTLMMNYVAMQVITYCIIFWENPKGSNSVGTINSATKGGWLPKFFGLDYGWNLVIVLALTLAMFIYLKYSKQGYEIAVVGESENTARYAGINGPVRGNLRHCRFYHCKRRKPHHIHQYGRRTGIYGNHRVMAQQVQCICYDPGILFPGIHAKRRRADCIPVQPE